MRFQVLGPLRALIDDEWREPSAAKQRTILGILLAQVNRAVPTERLLDEIWGEAQPSGASRTLRSYLSRVRDWLEPDREPGSHGMIETVPGGYMLRVAPEEIDAGRFERLATEGDRALVDGSPSRARTRFDEALSLWNGDAFEDFRYQDFARGEITRLEERRLACIEGRIEADLELGRHREVVADLRELVEEHPSREGYVRQLMMALYHGGRQHEALEVFQTARRWLADEAGLEPSPELREVESQILAHGIVAATPTARATGNLPARIASFVGRERELHQIAEKLERHRLVTVTGFGGVGKTTSALEVARSVVERYADGGWLVRLADVAESESVVDAFAAALDVQVHPSRPLLDVIVEENASRERLVVVDNCEHLTGAAARVTATLLEGCPRVRILATSREPLSVPGEQIWPLRPLDVPSGSSEAEGDPSDAVQLFAARATESNPEFALDDGNRHAVESLCRRLDGVPLALELAAARTRTLPVDDLLRHLDAGFDVLVERGAPARHRTLAATVGWSYDLLDADERALFRRLGVFSGGFSIPAAECVCSGDDIEQGDVLSLLGRLVDASLVTIVSRDPVRYGFLEAVHEFAVRSLADAGEEKRFRTRHVEYFATRAPRNPAYGTPEFRELLDAMSLDADNYLRALASAIDIEEGQRAVDLAADLARYWSFRAPREDAAHWLERARAVAPETVSLERAVVLLWCATLASVSGHRGHAKETLAEASLVAAEVGEPMLDAFVSNTEQNLLDSDGRLRAALSLVEEQIALLDEADSPAIALHLGNAADYALRLGEYERADNHIDALESLGRRYDEAAVTGEVDGLRASVAFFRGDLDVASTLLERALEQADRGDRPDVRRFAVRELAWLARARGQATIAADLAAELVGIGREIRESRTMVEGLVIRALVDGAGDRIAEAGRSGSEATRVATASDDAWALTLVAWLAAQIATAMSDSTSAVQLHAAAEASRSAIEYCLPAARREEIDREVDRWRSSLGLDRFTHLWGAGAELASADLLALMRRVFDEAASR